MHTPALEEFELEDLSSEDIMSDEQLAEHATRDDENVREEDHEQELEFEEIDDEGIPGQNSAADDIVVDEDKPADNPPSQESEIEATTSEIADKDAPSSDEYTAHSDHLNENLQSALLQRLDTLIALIENKQHQAEDVQQAPNKQFAKAVHFVKSDNNHYLGAKWFRKAAMQGHAKAQLYLGLMFLKGEGLPKSFFHAYSWLSLASCQEVAEAKEALKKLEPHLTVKEMKAALKHAAFLMETILES